MGFGNAAFNFSIGDVIRGIVWSIISLIFILLIINGRVINFFTTRELPNLGAFMFFLVALAVVIGAVSDLLTMDLSILNKPYLPGIITSIEALGSFVLVGVFIWQLYRFVRQ
jgi:hypothetical protein